MLPTDEFSVMWADHDADRVSLAASWYEPGAEPIADRFHLAGVLSPMARFRLLRRLRHPFGGNWEPEAQTTEEKAGPAKLLLVGYISYMIAGWILLSLPIAHRAHVAALDNLFIAVSAVSTTGLVTVDPGQSYSIFGQIVLLLLIQLGGLGYMTMTSVAMISTHRELGPVRTNTARTAFSLPDSMDLKLFLRSVMLFTLIVELAGAAALYPFFAAAGTPNPVWSAIFHAVSAFCTAGFSLNPDSLEAFRDNTPVNAIISVLCLLGAMGFIIVVDIFRRMVGSNRHLSFTSKVILRLTATFILFGTILIFLAEPSITTLAPTDRLLAAFFQAMSASTTVGFDTVSIGPMSHAAIMVLLVLMIVGASPAGTGGGLKTTSVAALIGLVRSTLKGRDEIRVFKRRVPPARLQAATATLTFYAILITIALFLLFLTEPQAAFEKVLFETVSAIGTVGLSMGLTSDLSDLGKVIIIVLMTAGRLGILTFGLAITTHDESREEESDNELAI